MAAEDTAPRIGLARSLLFWGATVVLLAPLVTLVVHRIRIPVSVSQKNEEIEHTVAAALQESQRLLQANQAEKSLVYIQRVLAISPNNAPAYNNLCVAYGLLGQRAKAVAACNRAVSLEPSNERARNNLRWVSSLSERATP
jgi:Flp pilus assembly protein TadD